MAKYSKSAGKKVEKVMKEKKSGTLKTGSGKKVTSKKQAIAIGLSEVRKQGSKVPAPAKKSAPKKAPPKKAAPKKAAPKKAAPKKAAPKKAAPKKAAPKKAAPKKAAPKKAAPKKAAPKKAAPKKVTPVKKSAPVKKAAPAKVAAPKKSPIKKASPAKKQSLLPAVVAPPAPLEETNLPADTTATPDESPAKTPGQTTVEIPTEENTEKHQPVEEPTEVNPLTAEHHGAPVPPDKYAAAKDTYHGHINPSSKKSSVKPSGKKPLWNK